MFYDAHIHNKNNESGGFLIALDGEPYTEGTLNNTQALTSADSNYTTFYYITSKEIEKNISHKYLKYHPRREKYLPEQVIKSIKLNKPKCAMIDTLNEPY